MNAESRNRRPPRDDVTSHIVDAALQIHKELGPGLLESAYEAILARRLADRGLRVERQKPIDFVYDGVTYQEGLRRVVNSCSFVAPSKLCSMRHRPRQDPVG